LPFAPGIATASELMQALRRFGLVKFFPAEQSGGIKALRALAAFRRPFVRPAASARPARSWLAEPNVSRVAVLGYVRLRISAPATGAANRHV